MNISTVLLPIFYDFYDLFLKITYKQYTKQHDISVVDYTAYSKQEKMFARFLIYKKNWFLFHIRILMLASIMVLCFFIGVCLFSFVDCDDIYTYLPIMCALITVFLSQKENKIRNVICIEHNEYSNISYIYYCLYIIIFAILCQNHNPLWLFCCVIVHYKHLHYHIMWIDRLSIKKK